MSEQNVTEKIKQEYLPTIKIVENLAGYAARATLNDESTPVIVKGFLDSYTHSNHRVISQFTSTFVDASWRDLNQLLVVIRNNEARIYKHFPLVLMIRAKRSIEAFTPVTSSDILDIESVCFKDAFFDLDVQDGDKFLWLFRAGWSFGMFFDFSGKLKCSEIFRELGYCFKRLHFYGLYASIENVQVTESLFQRGWFPFFQLLPDDYLALTSCADESEFHATETAILRKFSKDRIEIVMANWWSNPIFAQKRSLIEAGVEAFVTGGKSNIINSIKNLSSEVEGVMQLDYLRTKVTKAKATSKELKDHIRQRASRTFESFGSLAFPGEFYEYLNAVLFKSFDLSGKDDIKLSRHSVAHGVAPEELFQPIRALQLILILDQMHYYLMTSSTESKTPLE